MGAEINSMSDEPHGATSVCYNNSGLLFFSFGNVEFTPGTSQQRREGAVVCLGQRGTRGCCALQPGHLWEAEKTPGSHQSKEEGRQRVLLQAVLSDPTCTQPAWV